MKDYLESPGGILLPQHGPDDLRPRKINVLCRGGKANPDGAILAMASTIGLPVAEAEKIYRKMGYDPTFVEVAAGQTVTDIT